MFIQPRTLDCNVVYSCRSRHQKHVSLTWHWQNRDWDYSQNTESFEMLDFQPTMPHITSSTSFMTSFWIISLLHNNKPTDQNVLCNSVTNQMSFHSSHSLSHCLYTHIHQKKHTNTLWPVTVTNSNMTHMFQLCVGELASLAGCLSSGFLCLPALPVFNIVRDVVNNLLKTQVQGDQKQQTPTVDRKWRILPSVVAEV